ncbi:hypothetical protein EMIT0111MI5_20479 [Burkholderia sp. IT-111MI5]
MYLVMLCFFFISNPNYRACASNGWKIIRVRLRIGTHVATRATGPLPAVAMADRGGILTQMARRLSNLKAKGLIRVHAAAVKAGSVAIRPNGASGYRAPRPRWTDRPPVPARDDTGRRSRHIHTKMRRPRHYRA